MAHTLAAVFEQRGAAERARQELITAGLASASIRLHDAGSEGMASGEYTHGGDSLLGNIKHFFSDLLGSHDDHHMYAEAVRRGHVVLTLEGASDADIQRATDIVERHDPINVDDHVDRWRAGGWHSASMHGQGSGGMRQGASMQSGAPSQQNTPVGNQSQEGAASRQFAGSMPTSTPQTGSGATVRRYPSADNLQRTNDDDEEYYRNHWSSMYASGGGRFDDYDPAYRYGHSMAGSDSYRGQSWEQVEAELRGNWEHTYPQSAWDDFKAAVRHGWDRLAS